jgi:probable phosphoglycerate mutase
MKLYITRHGETNYNKRGLVCGVTNAQLTDKGIAQANLLAQDIKENKGKYNIKHIYVSPLDRARNTSKPIEDVLNITAEVEPGIIEFNFGKYEECPVGDVEFRKLRRQPFMKFQNGESILSATHRIYSTIDKIIDGHKEDDGNVLLVCHGTCARIISTYFNDVLESDYYNLLMNNCELIEFNIE